MQVSRMIWCSWVRSKTWQPLAVQRQKILGLKALHGPCCTVGVDSRWGGSLQQRVLSCSLLNFSVYDELASLGNCAWQSHLLCRVYTVCPHLSLREVDFMNTACEVLSIPEIRGGHYGFTDMALVQFYAAIMTFEENRCVSTLWHARTEVSSQPAVDVQQYL